MQRSTPFDIATCMYYSGSCNALIPAHPPKEALRARREHANQAMRGDHVHTVPNPGNASKGYRPDRKTARRQNRQRKQGALDQ